MKKYQKNLIIGAIIGFIILSNIVPIANGKDLDCKIENLIPNSSGKSVNWKHFGVEVCDAVNNQENIALVEDGLGGAYIIWIDERDTDKDVYIQRLDENGFPQWEDNGVAVVNLDYDQNYAKAISCEDNGVIITWEDQRDSGNSDIYAQKVNINGTYLWGANGTAICTASNSQTYPELCTDGDSGAIITWSDFRNGVYDVFAQKINKDGIIQWTTNGVAVNIESFWQNPTKICTDDNGGAYIVWRNNSGIPYRYDVWIQRINNNGVNQFPSGNPIAVCDEINDQEYFWIDADYNGNAIVVWLDDRLHQDISSIYAQKIGPDGSKIWNSDGVPVYNELYQTTFILGIDCDKYGNTYVLWYGNRTASYEIYSQLLSSNGVINWTSTGVPITAGTGTSYRGHIAADPEEGAYVVYGKNYGSDYFLTGNYLLSNGTLRYGMSGINISDYTLSSMNPQVIFDGNKGYITAWVELSNGKDIRCVRYSEMNLVPGTDVTTTLTRDDKIDWLLEGVFGDKMRYKVEVEGPSGIFTLRDWSTYYFDEILYFPIDKTEVGVFNYTIYTHEVVHLTNLSDTVTVTITKGIFGLSESIKDIVLIVLAGLVGLLSIWSVIQRKNFQSLKRDVEFLKEELPQKRKISKLDTTNVKKENISKEKSKSNSKKKTKLKPKDNKK